MINYKKNSSNNWIIVLTIYHIAKFQKSLVPLERWVALDWN